jgi:hypothetical protein
MKTAIPTQKVLIEVEFITEMSPDNQNHLNFLVENQLKYHGIKLGEACHGLIYKII